MRKKHLKALKFRTKGELYNMRKGTFNQYNKAVRDGHRVSGKYYQGMCDMLRWVMCEK